MVTRFWFDYYRKEIPTDVLAVLLTGNVAAAATGSAIVCKYAFYLLSDVLVLTIVEAI